MIKRTLYTFFTMIAFLQMLRCSTDHVGDSLETAGVHPQDLSSRFTLVHMEPESSSKSPIDERASTAEPDRTIIDVPPIDTSNIHTGFTSSSEALSSREDLNNDEVSDLDKLSFQQIDSRETTPGMRPQVPNTSMIEKMLLDTTSGSSSDLSDHDKVHPESTKKEGPGDTLDPNLVNHKPTFSKEDLQIKSKISLEKLWNPSKYIEGGETLIDGGDESIDSDTDSEFDEHDNSIRSFIIGMQKIEWMNNAVVLCFVSIFLVRIIDFISYMF